MLVTDKIYIDMDLEPTDERIFDMLTYRNPEYYQKMNMGLSVYKVPQEIKTGWIKDRMLEVMRGEALKIKPYFGDKWKPQFDHPDHPIALRYVNNDFELDEYQNAAVEAMKSTRQGIVHAVTSAGKSLIMLKAICEIGQKAVIIVHRKVLMEQLLTDIDKYVRNEKGGKITPGIIGNGSLTVGAITVAIDKTLGKNIEKYRNDFGTVILDECHLAPAATIFSLLNALNSRNRFGLTGTLRRKDEKQFLIYATFGQVIATIDKDTLIERGRIVPVEVELWGSETRFDWDSVVEGLTEKGSKNPTQEARMLQEKVIREDPNRNDMILRRLNELEGKTIVLSRYVQPCYSLQKSFLERFNRQSGVITGKDAKEGLSSYKGMKEADLQTIFATIGCIAEGVSISDLANIVLISPVYNNELLLHQIRGRLMRAFPGKTHGTLYFVYDLYIFPQHKLKQFLAIIKK